MKFVEVEVFVLNVYVGIEVDIVINIFVLDNNDIVLNF